jgi:hypothetical protein
MTTPLALTDVLKVLEHPDGGFVDFNPASPNLYATYYSLKTLDLPSFDQKIPHRTKTIEWLEQLAERGFEVGGPEDSQLGDIYFGTKCLELLDVTVNRAQTNAIIEMAEAVTDGIPSAIREGAAVDPAQYALKTVYWLLYVYDTLDVPLDPSAEFESWLTERWRAWGPSDFPAKMSNMLQTYRSLRFVGYDRDEILNVRDPRDEIASIVSRSVNWSTTEEFALLNIGGARDFMAEMELDETLPDSVVGDVAASQNRDGGFSLLAAPISDCRGTYIALYILSGRDRTDAIDCEAVRNFVLFKTVSSGGFSLHYRQDPGFDPTFAVHWFLSNTTKGYDVATNLGRTIPEELYPDELFTPTKLYKVLTIHERVEEPAPTVDIDAFIDTYLHSVPSLEVPEQDLLKNVHYSLLLDRDFASEPRYRDSTDETVIDVVRETRNENEGFGDRAPVPVLETFHAVHSLRYLGRSPSDQSLVRWLRDHQNDDGGFGEPAGIDSRSDIVTTYYAVRTLSLLGAEIADIASIRSWLHDFRHVNGGWPRGTHAQYDSPRIRYTVLAMDLKRRLDELEARKVAEPSRVVE